MGILNGATTAAQMGTRHGSYTSGSGDPTGTSPGGTVPSQYDRTATERGIDNTLNVIESDTFNYAVSGSILAYSAANGAIAASGAGTSVLAGAASGAAPVAVALGAGIAGGLAGAWVGDKLGHAVMSRIPGFNRLPETGEMPATTGHPIAHTSLLATLGALALGAIAGLAVGVFIVATGGTGLLVIAAAAAAGGALAGLGAGFASAAGQYGTNKGVIGPGSPNVFFEGRPVAHVMTPVACTIHKVAACAQGAETVFVNNWPMTRIGHKTTCDGVVNDGCKSIAIDMDTSAIALDIDGGWMRRWTRIGLAVLNFLPIPRGKGRGNKSNLVDGAPPPNCRTCRGDPVDVASGTLVDTRTDFALPGTIPLVLTRSYSRGAEGLMGRDWASSWGRFLRISGETTTYQDADGMRVVFHTPDADILATNLRMPHLEMLGQRDGEIFIFDRREQLFHCFGQRVGDRLLLTAIEDRNGNRISFRYRGADLFEITHSDGYKLDVNCEAGVIRALSLAGHETGDCNATWAYSSQGRLVEARSPQFGTLIYGYDDQGRINRWADTNATEVFYAYDGDRIVRSWTTSGHMGVRLQHFPAEQRTVVYFTDGHHETFHYDKDGLVWKGIDGRGAVWLTEWDNRFNVTARVDPSGNRTEFTYDAGGNLTSAKDPTGASLSWSFDANGQLASRTDAAGATESFVYDDKGNLSAVVDAMGGRVAFRRGDKGEVLRIDLPGGGQERIYYDQFLRPIRRIDPDGATQNMTYDREGRLIQLVDPEGGITRFDVTRGPDNPRGSVRRVDLADGGSAQMTWDGEGQLASVTDGEGNTRSFRAGAFDLPLAAIDEAGQSLTFEHDTELRLTAVINALGERYDYTYDVTGALVAEKDFSGLVTRYERDLSGRMTTRIAPDGTVTRFAYDARGDLTEIQVMDRDGPRITRLEHDARGLLTLAENADGKVEFAYDILGRLVSEKLNGREIRSTYAPSSGLRTARMGDVLSLSLSYTLAGLPNELRVGAHAPLAMHHDGRGLEVLRHSAAGFAMAQNYTAGGMLQTQLAGPAASLPDPVRLGQSGTASRHSLMPGPSTRAFRSYDWDRAGRAVAIKDGHWGESRFAYDKRGQVVATGLRDRSGVEVARTGYDYDPARNLAAIHSLAGFAKVEQSKGGRTRTRGQTFYQHDANGRVIEKRVEEPGFRPRIWRMAWNGEDRLVRLETPDGAVWAYAYDPLGRRIRRLKLVAGSRDEDRDTPPGGGFAYQWDGDQIVAEAPIYADGTVAWDRAEAWVYEPGSFRPLAKLQGEDLYYVVTDHIGTPRELISEDGTRTAWRARLGLWGETEALTRRAANDNAAPDCAIRFQGQWFDEESGLHYNRFRYYDPEAGQYLSPDPIGLAGGVRPQGYVADPNGWVDPLGLAGCSDRLRANMMEDMGLPRATRAPGYQAQHLVPGSLSNHPAVKLAGIDIDSAPNGIFLPDNRAPISPLSRHQGSHPGYNQAVEAALNRIDLSKGQQHAASQISGMQDILRANQQNGVPIRSADWVGPYTPGGTATGTSRAFNRWDSILRGAGF